MQCAKRLGLLAAPQGTKSSVIVRCMSTAKPEAAISDAAKQRQAKKEKSLKKKATHSKSFVQNMFRGIVHLEQTFPFPKVLNEEQADTLSMLVEPTEKYMSEQNDPAWNDANETVHPDTTQVGFAG